MRLVVYDYTEENIRGRVRKSLKKDGLHVQLSVFETQESLQDIKSKIIREDSPNFRIVVFRIRRNAQTIKIGKHFDHSDDIVL